MTPIRPLARPLAASLALALAALVSSAPVIAKGAPREAPPVAVKYHFNGVEDEAVELDLGPGFTPGGVMVAPSHGTLMTDRLPLKFIPHADFNGDDVLVISGLDGNGGKTEVQVTLSIAPVNDAPSFTGSTGRAHQREETGSFVVDRWALAISAGPAEEPRTQRVSFVAERIDDAHGAVEDLVVDADGALRYTLTRRGGVSTWAVRAVDTGDAGDREGAQSQPQLVRIGVGEATDLAIKVASDAGEEILPTSTYQLFVSNVGKRHAMGTRVVDLPSDGGANAQWSCQGFDGGSCPKTASGSGPIDQLVDLPEGGFVVFRVTGVQGGMSTLGHRAFVQPPDYMVDIDLSNNAASL
jgi:hypothetical protein